MQQNRTKSLRARGSLTYLEFIRLVKSIWEDGHPDIPILPTGGENTAVYPCILYGLELRTAHRDDPKPRRFREISDKDAESSIITTSQRFDNIVSFVAVAERDPILAEEIIEAFEDFMTEITPVLKELGASEIVYSRRYPDSEQGRQGEGVAMRKVAYKLTTEKVVATEIEKLEAISISIRNKEWLDGELPVTTSNLGDSPRYYSASGMSPTFYITPDSKASNLVIIPFTFFRPGDVIYLAHGLTGEYPASLDSGYYEVLNFQGVTYSKEISYEIARRGSDDLVTDFGPDTTPNDNGYIYSGKVFFVVEGLVDVNMIDNNAA